MSRISSHKLADVIFGVTQKSLYIINLGQNLFCNLKSDLPLVPGRFCFS